MSESQKIIKYFALGLAFMIIFSIISIFFNVIESLFFDSNDSLKDKSEYKLEYNNVVGLDIEIKNGKFNIVSGSEFKVITNIKKIKNYTEGGILNIKDESSSFNSKELTLVVPDIVYNEVSIELGAVKANIESIKTNKFDMDMSAGNVVIDNIIVNNEADIETGAGKFNIKNASITNLDLDMGAGKTVINGVLKGSTHFDMGVGALEVNLNDSLDNYKFTVDKGIGSIKLNDNSLSDNTTIGSGINTINIDGGIGKLSITTK